MIWSGRSIRDVEYYQQYLLVVLIFMPWFVYFGFMFSHGAAFFNKREGSGIERLPFSTVPIYSNEGVVSFFEKAVSTELSTSWKGATAHYTKPRSRFFNASAWRQLRDIQEKDGVGPYLEENHINRFVIPLDRAIVVRKYRQGNHNYFMVEGMFLSTFRSITGQRSTRYLVHGVLRTSSLESGEAIEIIVYNQERRG